MPALSLFFTFAPIQRAALGKFASRAAAKQREHEDRTALFERRNRAGGEHSITIDAYTKESRNLTSASAALDDAIGSATASYSSLMQQRQALKGVQRKVRDVAEKIGLSNKVVSMIESRQFWDKMLLYGGMLLTLALLWFVFRHLRK